MNDHLTDDDLVLHFYGEMEHAAEAQAASHLAGCGDCRRSYTRLQRVLAAVDAMPAPALPDGFERTVWARLEPALPARRGWFSWFVAGPANLAWAAAVLLLVAGAFFAGRLSTPPAGTGAAQMASADEIREAVLLSDLGEHLDRSQTVLIELASAEGPAASDGVDMSLERERAEDLLAANRLYRQTATASGDTAVTELLDELERLLVELAASPDQMSPEDLERVQQRIATKDL
ncbi:MAG: hypothetical protein WEB50_13755, partial [Vicinamibacterales bacterium]